jgi:hypothetical protein
LRDVRNTTAADNTLLREAVRELRRRLPPGWSLSEPTLEPGPRYADAKVELAAPDRRACQLALEARVELAPKGVGPLVDATRELRMYGPIVVLARYLSEGTRQRLRDADLGYLDLSGNVRILVAEPGLYIETQGATEDPDREERPARSLRGPKAGRIVRVLIDRKVPPGVRELAAFTNIDAGYVSRVLAFLDAEALVTRVGRGRMHSVDWPALLRRWAHEAPIESRGSVRTYLEPRGLSALTARLGASAEHYAVTGGLAAAAFAPIAPARLAAIWMRDAAAAASRLGLRPAESGANVLLIEPNDDGVFVGASRRDGLGLRMAAPSQISVDLLTSPGRGPAEGEELIAWMKANEDKWRQ